MRRSPLSRPSGGEKLTMRSGVETSPEIRSAAIWLPVGVRATNNRIPKATTSTIATAASTNVAIHFNRRIITVMPDNFTFQPLFGPSLERLSNAGVNAIVAAAFVFGEGPCHEIGRAAGRERVWQYV